MPITATRLPARSTSWFQRAEWKISPWKPSMPSIAGSLGADSPPAPEIRVVAVQVCSSTAPVPSVVRVRTVQCRAVSSQSAPSTSVSNTNRSSTPDPAATFRR